MKNGIIILLVLFCVFFLMNALGVFQFGSIFDRDHRTWHENARVKAVEKALVFKLGTAYDSDDQPAAEAVQGMVLAMEILNRKGGILGRKLQLVKRDNSATISHYLAAVQEFCDDHEIAAVIGPFSSGYIPSVRALTQFQGLPLISPLTVSSEKLPPLDPDNFVTFFPPLELWSNAILEDMEKKGNKNLLIISPETDTYGDIFCTAIERMGRQRPVFERVYRLNYQIPLRRRDLLRAVQNYSGKHYSNVIFFGGTFSDFPEFTALMKEMKMEIPVYGSDDLYIPQMQEISLPFPLLLPQAMIRRQNTQFIEEWKMRFGKNPSYHTILGAESVFAIAKVLNQDGRYEPQQLVKSLRKMQEKRLHDSEKAPMIIIEEFNNASKKI